MDSAVEARSVTLSPASVPPAVGLVGRVPIATQVRFILMGCLCVCVCVCVCARAREGGGGGSVCVCVYGGGVGGGGGCAFACVHSPRSLCVV